MDSEEIRQLLAPLWADLAEEQKALEQGKIPLLAHYTSLDVLEKMLKCNEVWLSNPLFMNDLEEVKFGLLEGIAVLHRSKAIMEALKTPQLFGVFATFLDAFSRHFQDKYLLDTYVFCLSEHDPNKYPDGRLSMWRGYGASGNGVALVFAPAGKVLTGGGGPLILGQVHYGSREKRIAHIEHYAATFARLIGSHAHALSEKELTNATFQLFERLKLFALFTKHDGFHEEAEWRVVYLRDRDTKDQLTGYLGYFNGGKGVEPKLKLKMKPVEGVTVPDFSFETFIRTVLLGPSLSPELTRRSVCRMLEVIGRSELIGRVVVSGIPLRKG